MSTFIHIRKAKKRLDDCLDALTWVFETAKKNNIKNILFGGDFFHDRSKIESLVLHKTFNILKKYLDGSINFYILLGNHDLLYFEKTTNQFCHSHIWIAKCSYNQQS